MPNPRVYIDIVRENEHGMRESYHPKNDPCTLEEAREFIQQMEEKFAEK